MSDPLESHVPEHGKIVLVESIPDCDFCVVPTPGPYDFKTIWGPWAHGCEYHWRRDGAYDQLGVGRGQLWITPEQADLTVKEN